jgi:hypothetical protein
MRQRLLWTVVAIALISGCASARIVKSDVVGPHGEHLLELVCQAPDGCMDLARRACAGDFNVITNNGVASSVGETVMSQEVMLVQCKNPPPIAPAAAPAQRKPSQGEFAACSSSDDCEIGICLEQHCRH